MLSPEIIADAAEEKIQEYLMMGFQMTMLCLATTEAWGGSSCEIQSQLPSTPARRAWEGTALVAGPLGNCCARQLPRSAPQNL